MKLTRKQILIFFILLLVFTLSACSTTKQTEENNLTDSAVSTDKTVSVVRGTITPTVSAQTTIAPAVPWRVSYQDRNRRKNYCWTGHWNGEWKRIEIPG